MTRDDFLLMDRETQNRLLLKMAGNALVVLTDFPHVENLAKTAYGMLWKHLNNKSLSAVEIGRYLSHADENQDMGMQIYNVNNCRSAISAIDILCYAIGAISKEAFEKQGIADQMPDPVQESRPEVVVDAISQYEDLVHKGLVPDVA